MSIKLPHKNCLNCNKETKRTTTQYCSFKCRSVYYKDNKIHHGGQKHNVPRLPKKQNIKYGQCIWCCTILHRSKIKFCSISCATTFRNLDGIQKEIKPKLCLICSTSFIPHLSESKYCSVKCVHTSKLGQKFSKEHREKLSIAAAARIAQSVYTKGVGGIRLDIGHYVRSSWEANICRLLVYLNIPYQFEKYKFTLMDIDGKEIIYTPDYKIHNRFIEVKGWWTQKSLLLKKLMMEQYPEIRITYIDERFYNRVKRKYAAKIINWEFKTHNQRKRGLNTCI